ncbi:MAG: hypothetical protein AAGD00_09075 [Planctomycetota bacterium]
MTAEGVAAALAFAERRGVEHVVLVLDSERGRLFESVRIAEVLAERPDSIQVSAFVAAASAYATPIVLASDRVFVSDGLAADIAFGFASIEGLDDAQLVETFETLAQAGGRDIASARALIQRPGVTIGPSGLGAVRVSGAPAIGAAMGIEEWASAGRHGNAILKRTIDEQVESEVALRTSLAEIAQETTALIGKIEYSIPAQIQEARAKDPDSFFDYEYYMYEYTFTPESETKWRNRTDEAVKHWRGVLRTVETVAKHQSETEDLLNGVEVRTTAESESVYWAFLPDHRAQAQSARAEMDRLHAYGESLSRFRDQVQTKIDDLIADRHRGVLKR